jgi:hypothetical protein
MATQKPLSDKSLPKPVPSLIKNLWQDMAQTRQKAMTDYQTAQKNREAAHRLWLAEHGIRRPFSQRWQTLPKS